MSKTLVTGATGTVGQALIKSLKSKNADFLAGVRDTDSASKKLPGVRLISFDFADISTFDAATEDVDQVFLLGPPLVTNLDEVLTPFIDFLKKKGIRKVTYLASLGCEKMKDMPFHTIVTDKLRTDGFSCTILKPSFFAQNFKNYEWDNITQRGVVFSPAGMGKVGFIDVADIGEVAACALTTDGHAHQTYELTGPDLFTYKEATAILSDIIGKPVNYANPGTLEYTEALKAAGAPDFIAPYMITVYSLIADGQVNTLTKTVEQITGKRPTGLRQVFERDFSGLVKK